MKKENAKRTQYWREKKRQQRAKQKQNELKQAVLTKNEQNFLDGHMLKRQHAIDVAVLSRDRCYD
jgi:hypothetical protein